LATGDIFSMSWECPATYSLIGGGYASTFPQVVPYKVTINTTSDPNNAHYEVDFVNLGAATVTPYLNVSTFCAKFSTDPP